MPWFLLFSLPNLLWGFLPSGVGILSPTVNSLTRGLYPLEIQVEIQDVPLEFIIEFIKE